MSWIDTSYPSKIHSYPSKLGRTRCWDLICSRRSMWNGGFSLIGPVFPRFEKIFQFFYSSMWNGGFSLTHWVQHLVCFFSFYLSWCRCTSNDFLQSSWVTVTTWAWSLRIESMYSKCHGVSGQRYAAFSIVLVNSEYTSHPYMKETFRTKFIISNTPWPRRLIK